MEQQTTLSRKSLPDPFDDNIVNSEVKRNKRKDLCFALLINVNLGLARENILLSDTIGYDHGFIPTFTLLFF